MTELLHTFGTDPEAFIFDRNIPDPKLGPIPNIIPPIALVKDFGATYIEIKGKKVLLSGDNFQWSEDGAAIELQMSPTNDPVVFWNRLQDAKLYLNLFLKPFNLKASTYVPVGYFDVKTYWKNRDEDFQSCVIFGCDPDRFPNMYMQMGLDKAVSKEINVSKHTYRYGGGHIHIQAPKKTPEIYINNWPTASIVFDFLAGLGNVTAQRSPIMKKLEKFRLKYYGRPGRIRLQMYSQKPKLYGIEYRVLSNYWTRDYGTTYRNLMLLDIAASIIEKEQAQKFIGTFEKDIPQMYRSIVTLNDITASKIFHKCIMWLLKNNLIYTNQLEGILHARH